MAAEKKQLKAPEVPDSPALKMERWADGKINVGMITMIEPSNLPLNAMQLVQNARVRFDITSRRPACKIFVPAKPDSNAVLALVFIKDKLGNSQTLRVTKSTISKLTSGSWFPYTITPALTGTDSDRFQFVDILDEFISANNGADPIQKINQATHTVVPLGNAPAYRYITGFYNRVVGAALRGINEAQVGWSGDGNAAEFDPLVDETAGSAPLVESPSDLSDFLKGIFGFTNVMAVLREKSVWLATKQPIPTNPFYFYSAVPGIGCDCPFSAQMISNGLAWLDRRTKTVYAYSPGGVIDAIGRPIEKTLLDDVDNVDTVFASFDNEFNEYTVYIPTTGSDYVKAWTFNFNTKAWTYNEYYQITSAHSTELVIGGMLIEDLEGVIEDLEGTIEDLSDSELLSNARTYGRADGTIMMEDPTVNKDAEYAGFPAGVPFNTILVSKVFKIPSNDIYIAQAVIEYKAQNAGDIMKLEYSKNDGKTWVTYKTIIPTMFDQSVLFIFKKMFRARRFTWRLTSDAPGLEITGYEVWVYPSGASRR